MKKVTIELSEDQLVALQKRVDEKDDFDTVEAYIQDIVAQVVDRLTEEAEEESFSQEDEEKVKERLRSLGYLD